METEKKKMGRKGKGGEGGGRRKEKGDGDRAEYDPLVAYLPSTRYSHSGFTLDCARCR